MSKFVKDEKEFFAFCDENEVAFVDFRFTDMKGTWHHMTYNYKRLSKDVFKEGIAFDASSIDAWQPIDKSDMILMPEANTAFLDPFTADITVVVICDVYDIYKGQMYEKCPRSIAKKAEVFLKESGIGDVCYFGPENEFFVFDDVKIIDKPNIASYEIDSEEGSWNGGKNFKDSYNTGHRPSPKGGYFPVQPVDSMVDLRAEMVQVLEQIGLEVFIAHHEAAQAQGEIGVKFGTLVEAADNVQKYKYVVKMVAHLNGKTATFMPKPILGDNGSGMHIHQSIWKDGVNLFYDKNGYGGLSEFAKHYIGGVLKHARSLTAFTNPSTNSFKRLIPDFEAPNILTYSCQNRSASIRIPYGCGEKSARAEIRFPDSTSCPYLAFASLLLAGIDGIKNKYEPVGPMDENLFVLTLDEIRDRGIEQLPHTLRGSLESLIRDNEYLKPIMTKLFIDTYQNFKFRTQVWPYEARPTAFEFKTCYSC
ncbi:MAG: type I glutamate--ammonia ligase [Campylobacter sp.]|nr:type I glutamate--ammonia ligase [Campylobacter sp.]